MKSNLNFAVEVCTLIEGLAPLAGCHVALTGGNLYKKGNRKDLDILFYRIRQVDEIDKELLFKSLMNVGFDEPTGFGWCHKTEYNGVSIDMFFPEESEGEYISAVSAIIEIDAACDIFK